MAFLAMDTATSALAVAIGTDKERLATAALMVPRGHSRLLQPTVQSLLQASSLQPADLSGICVGLGPGSYTGVRLAVTTAKAMAVALSIPVYPVSTLAVLAEAVLAGDSPTDRPVLALLYARRKRAFGAVYRQRDAHLVCEVEPQVRDFAEWATLYHQQEGPCLLVHDMEAVAEAQPFVEELSSSSPMIYTLSTAAPSMGWAMIRLATRQDVGCFPRMEEDVHGLVPDYALRVEAEVKQGEGAAHRGSD